MSGLFVHSAIPTHSTIETIFESAHLPLEAVGLLDGLVAGREVSKGSILIKQGQVCDHFYVIQKGFARIYSTIKEKQITTLFARENDIITSTYALFTRSRSEEYVEMLEDSELLQIHYEDFFGRCVEHPLLFNLYRSLMEKYYLALEERTLSLQFDNAEERYRKLLSRHPFILQRASLGSIASFLGMSPVTLSRMRARF